MATQPGITSTIVGATKVTQLDDNLASIDFAIPTDLQKGLMKRARWNRRILIFSTAVKFRRASRAGCRCILDAGADVQCAGESGC